MVEIDASEVSVERGPLRPLPVNLGSWRSRLLESARVLETIESRTEEGWPVTLVRSEQDGAHQLHGFFELIDRGCVVAIAGADRAAVDACRADLERAVVDWTSDELLAIVQLWESG